jgi:hypothetical protein
MELASICGTHDRRGVRGVGNKSWTGDNGTARVCSPYMFVIGGVDGLRVGANVDNGERLGAGVVDVVDVAEERGV